MNIGQKIINYMLIPLFLLCSCDNRNKQEMVKVVLEDGDYKCNNQVMNLPKGSDFTFEITLDISKSIASTSYENYSISENIINDVRYDKLTFHNVLYSSFISLNIVDSVKINYHVDEQIISEYVTKNHERVNTSIDYDKYKKEGYALTGWLKGEEIISLGSRVSVDKDITLIGRYLKESDKSLFEYELLDSSRASIKRYLGNEKVVVVPNKIDGHSVISVSKDAFNDLDIDELVLPHSLASVINSSFNNCHIKSLVIFDNITSINDGSFNNCVIDKVRINAVREPSYIRSYYGSYLEKFDRLYDLKDNKKIVLYGGSAARFGFDSELIDISLKEYDVVDMGVFAYAQSYPQIDILNNYINKEDILIVSPEFDTLETQFDLKNEVDEYLFAMCESNYDILSLLDVSKYQHFFSSFSKYQYNRNHLQTYSYLDTAYLYDEDGNYVSNHSYNRYGDYVVYRKNNEERKTFGSKRAFYNKTHFPMEMIDNFNNGFKKVVQKGVTLLFDYSPRSNISISEDSTPSSIIELDEYLKKNVKMTFISSSSDGLMDPLYFYGTDNHLSTEGVNIRTKRVVNALLNGHYI